MGHVYENPLLDPGLKPFRDHLYDEALVILENFLYANKKISGAEAGLLRKAWESSKAGNILIDAINYATGNENWGLGRSDLAGFIHRFSKVNGFLSGREKWHRNRIKNKAVKIFRGCSRQEFENDDLGLSWSLNRDVAEFFANRLPNGVGVVVEAVAPPLSIIAWLDTQESEVIAEIGNYSVISVTNFTKNSKMDDWIRGKVSAAKGV